MSISQAYDPSDARSIRAHRSVGRARRKGLRKRRLRLSSVDASSGRHVHPTTGPLESLTDRWQFFWAWGQRSWWRAAIWHLTRLILALPAFIVAIYATSSAFVGLVTVLVAYGLYRWFIA